MVDLASSDKSLSARLNLYKHRVPEELYDVTKDPDCLVNLINHKEHQNELQVLRTKLQAWMIETKDTPMLEVFQKREDREFSEAYVQKLEKESSARRGNKPKNKPRKKTDLIKWTVPENISYGQRATLIISHNIPQKLSEQLLHVTIKNEQGKRIERKVLKLSGSGKVEVDFDIPKTLQGNKVSFAAFVGSDYAKSLQHLNSKPINLK